jgi:chondroitin 4-sulfotransferase 11
MLGGSATTLSTLTGHLDLQYNASDKSRRPGMVGQEFTVFLKPYSAVYIDIAKVASSSLKATFAAVLGLDLDKAGGNPHEVEFPRPPEPSPAGERLYPGLYTFAFVRNPWDRLLSCYRDKIQGEVEGYTRISQSGVARCLARFDAFSATMSFEEFVHAVALIPDADADEHFRSQHKYLTNVWGEIAVDFVGRYENLESAFRHVAKRIGLPSGTSLPRLQANPQLVSYADYYTVATRNIVATRYAQDIALFSYHFG